MFNMNYNTKQSIVNKTTNQYILHLTILQQTLENLSHAQNHNKEHVIFKVF